MSSKKPSVKTGEKVLFGVVGVFILLAVIAYIILESVRLTSDTPMFENKTSFDFSEQGSIGSALFRESRCTSCHRALRNGTNMGLSLDGVGSERTYDWLYNFLKNPEQTYGASTLDHGAAPKEAAYVSRLPDDQLKAIAQFISELKAEQGSASAPVPPDGRSEFIDSMVKTWAPKEWKEKYSDVREKQPAQSE
ncbi:MAG: cytochrome c [Gammaproteobacteria bacterium]|nr:cytochrome c [Gammaproteobacteria bacterium]